MLHNAQNLIYIENNRRDFYFWLAKAPKGPSVKFKIHNIHHT